MRNRNFYSGVFAATALLVGACGGSGNGGGGQPPQNTAPSIGALSDVSIDQDKSTSALTLDVTDQQSGSDALTINVTGADETLLPAQGIALSSSGGARSLTLTPAEAAVGTTVVTVTATDPQGLSATRTFNFTVNAVSASFTKFASETFPVAADEPSRPLIGFTLDSDADDNDGVFDTLLQ